MDERTPGPWHILPPGSAALDDMMDYHKPKYAIYTDSWGDKVRHVCFGAIEPNARYIVRACNAHDALVKACNMVFDYDENVHKNVSEAICAALALAEGDA